MIQAEQVKNRRMKVVNVYPALDGVSPPTSTARSPSTTKTIANEKTSKFSRWNATSLAD
jgi:hypothetical protein